MDFEIFFPAALLALGPPPPWPADRTGDLAEYEMEFLALCQGADVLKLSHAGYPLAKYERYDKYRQIFSDFREWYRHYQRSLTPTFSPRNIRA
jgi:hypothetical protein